MKTDVMALEFCAKQIPLTQASSPTPAVRTDRMIHHKPSQRAITFT